MQNITTGRTGRAGATQKDTTMTNAIPTEIPAEPMTAARTRRLATVCFICGLPLCDAQSVELGIGPTCRKRLGLGPKGPNREEVNRLTALAAILAEDGDILAVIRIADGIGALGYPKVATAVRKRFVDITITEVGARLGPA